MKKSAGKIWALVLALCMTVGLLPIQQAAAAEASNTTMETAIQVTDGQTVTTEGESERGWYWYYIDTTKAGQIIRVQTADTGSGPQFYNAYGVRLENYGYPTDSGNIAVKVAAAESGRYYIRVDGPRSFTVTLTDGAPNVTMETAIPVQNGDTITPSGEVFGGIGYWYRIDTTKPGQFIQVQCTEYINDFRICDADEKNLPFSGGWGDRTVTAVTAAAGSYYIWFLDTRTFTVQLLDNDGNEPNQTADTATALTPGQPANFVVGYADVDCFSIQTTQPGQDVAVTISGFSYEVQGSIYVSVDGGTRHFVDKNKTLYFHAAEAGTHCIKINSGSMISLTVNADVLNGDENESNDTEETATALQIGTDCTFSVGGYGDEDWFTFEAAPDTESGKLYTLNFLDLNTDYSDQFFYDVYAPDGAAVSTGTKVNVRHANILSCDQQGLYKVRVYTALTDSWGGVSYANITRSNLRIRVEEGGADPYENNNTWLTAAQVGTDQPVQFILSDTTDEDWFRFVVPEPGMTLTMKFDSTLDVYLYRGEDLQQYGTAAQSLSGGRSSSGTGHYKFTEPGTYYLKLYASQSDVKADLRTMMLSLELPRDTENNDTWKQATPIYEGAPKAFDLSAYNDYDWFKIEVPERTQKLVVELRTAAGTSAWQYMSIYREIDFETAGDNAGAVQSGHEYRLTVNNPTAGTYYVCCSSYGMDLTICYALWGGDGAGSTMETAEYLAPGTWAESTEGKWFSLGELTAGSEIRTYRSGDAGCLQLKNAAGTALQYYYYNGIYSYTVPSDGTYYFYTELTPALDENGEKESIRFRYELGTENVTEAAIAGPDTVTLMVGETVQLSEYLSLNPADAVVNGYPDLFYFTILDNTDNAVSIDTWSCQLSGQQTGTATVRVRCHNNSSGGVSVADKMIQVTVVDGTEITDVSISGDPDELALGGKAALTAVLTPDSPAAAITWTSSDPNVLYVNSKGVVTAVGSGSASITASAPSGASDTVTITVTGSAETIPVSSVRLNKYSATIYMGEEPLHLTATVLPEDAEYSGVTWTSSNTGAATVDQTGKVTPVGPGVAVVTASAGGYKASCVVTVQAARVRVESIAFESEEIEIPLLGSGTTLLPVITPTEATVKTVTWVSSDERVAVVSRTGIVTPIAVGETTITVTTLDGGKTASILVRVVASAQPGDINMDGYVDAGDALLALKYAVGSITLTEEQLKVADVNKDGYVDAGDAIRILRYNAGLIEEL